MEKDISKRLFDIGRWDVQNREIIDKRRPHLIDVYVFEKPNRLVRVATYNTKKDTLTFYAFKNLQDDLWSKMAFVKEIMPHIKTRIKGE